MSAGDGWQDALPLPGTGAQPLGRLPRWADDERLALVAWSRLAEPEDGVAMAFVAHRGAREALERLRSPARVAAGECSEGESPALLQAGMGRWLARWDQVDPERDLARARAVGGRVLVPDDPGWPAGLDDLGVLRPFVLWARGPLEPDAARERSVALVGARAATAYGERIASALAVGVGDAGVTVVSGAALGIDGAAHRGALAAGAPTVAVLACGVDRAYPSAHSRLLQAVAAEGLVLSEVPPGSSPMRRRFLQRNRLIAALGSATVVVEAGWRSGALSTAYRAVDLLRPVGAVPGPVTSSSSEGCHRLLRTDAVCVTDAAQVLELVDPVQPDPVRLDVGRPHDGLRVEEAAVLDALPVRSPRPVERVAATAGLPDHVAAAALAVLVRRRLAVTEAGGWRRAAVDGAGGATPGRADPPAGRPAVPSRRAGLEREGPGR